MGISVSLPLAIELGVIVILTPILLAYHTRRQKEMRLARHAFWNDFVANRYYVHFAVYAFIVFFKELIDGLNEPIKSSTGDYTRWIHAIEGNLVYWIQTPLENFWLSKVLSFHYLFIYVFFFYYSAVYYLYSQDRDMLDKSVLAYLTVYVLAVPFYLFFNVEVTSSYIPAMKALLYNDSALYWEFLLSHDPLDNSVPSLHISMLLTFIFINILHTREKGIAIKQWRHRGFHLFILTNLMIYSFSILYLGIHWVTDILFGALVAGVAALFVHYTQPVLRAWADSAIEFRPPPRIAQNLLAQSIIIIALLALILGSVHFQSISEVKYPTMIHGPQDTKMEVLQPIEEGEMINITVTNLHENLTAEGVLVELTAGSFAMENGTINWTKLSLQYPVIYFSPNSTTNLTITQAETWFVLIIHHPEEIQVESEDADLATSEVLWLPIHIEVEYPQQEILQAVLLCMPALMIAAYVMHRVTMMRLAGIPLHESRFLQHLESE